MSLILLITSYEVMYFDFNAEIRRWDILSCSLSAVRNIE